MNLRCHVLPLLVCLAIAGSATAQESLSTAWNDALHARIESGMRGDRAVMTITPAVPRGATFVFDYPSDPTDGFNSTATPASDAGCNTGETLGACRKRTLAFVAAYWGSLLQSSVPIEANVSMPQVAGDCSNRPPYYGGAAPRYQISDFPHAPRWNTDYPAALANAIAGQDLNPTLEEIFAVLNEGADHGCEGTWAGWWYGTDAATPIPSDRLPMVAIMLHEFGHGLGFQSGYDVTSGQPSSSNTPIWGYYLYDITAGKRWKDMTDAERAASAKNDPNLVWTGPNTSRWAAKFLSPSVDVVVNAPAGSGGTYATAVSNSGVPLRSAFTSDVVAVNDGSGDPRDGCQIPFANAADLAGKIAVMDLYNCLINQKILNAQSQGAAAVLLSSLSPATPPSMYATGENARIPAYGIQQSLGGAMFTTPFNVTLQPRAEGGLYGGKDGCARMHAPATLAPGSSVSHFSGDGLPTMLMQSSAPLAVHEVGLSLNVMQDMGWTVRAEDGVFNDGFDGSPCAHAQP